MFEKSSGLLLAGLLLNVIKETQVQLNVVAVQTVASFPGYEKRFVFYKDCK